MLTKNVYYAVKPERFLITSTGNKAVVEFPLNVTEVEVEEGVQYLAESVYSLVTVNTANLADRIAQNYEAWLEKAKEPVSQEVTLEDVMEAVNVLTDIVLGGEF